MLRKVYFHIGASSAIIQIAVKEATTATRLLLTYRWASITTAISMNSRMIPLTADLPTSLGVKTRSPRHAHITSSINPAVEKRNTLRRKVGKPPTKRQEKKLETLQREIAELQDTTADKERELEESGYNVSAQTVIKASAFERAMKLEAELNKIHGRIIKLLDSIKGYELESRRVRLEERKYNLAKQKLSGAFDIDPDTGEINDEADGGDLGDDGPEL